MARLELSNIRKSFGQVSVLDGIDLVVENGEFCVFVGPSGCGKSTLLRIVAGLERNTSGKVVIGAQDVTASAPADRGVAMVFQSYALYPHMDVARNIGFGLMMQGVDRAAINEKVRAAADLLQITPLLGRRPSELSGGQRQRVAIGRALVRDPKIFLFDEPLSNLDASLRVQMRIEITRLHKRLGTTMVYVTHDQTEAMTMADRIVVLNGGRIEQTGDPLTLYNHPSNIFVGGFIGTPKMNFIPARVERSDDSGTALVLRGGARLALPSGKAPQRDADVTVGARAEHIRLGPPSGDGLDGVVELVENLGGEALVHVDCGSGNHLVVKDAGMTRWRAGDHIGVVFDTASCHILRN